LEVSGLLGKAGGEKGLMGNSKHETFLKMLQNMPEDKWLCIADLSKETTYQRGCQISTQELASLLKGYGLQRRRRSVRLKLLGSHTALYTSRSFYRKPVGWSLEKPKL